jgi:hypothetical protein
MGQNTDQDCLHQFEQVVATSNLIKPIPIYSITATQQKCARVEQQGSESTVVLPQIAICTLPNFYPGRQKRALTGAILIHVWLLHIPYPKSADAYQGEGHMPTTKHCTAGLHLPPVS